MQGAVKQLRDDYYTRAANDDCIKGGAGTRTKYSYDANGNMSSWAGEPITWSSYNYPTKINGTASFTYSYAPDRSVWLEVQNGGASASTYRLGSPLMSIVVASSGTTDRNYIYAGNDPVAIDERTSSSNKFYYLLKDHQGSISGITNSTGAVVVDESFHPDGQRRSPTTWTDPVAQSDVTTIQGISARGYTFKETLQFLNLVNLGGRVEDTVTGRFLSADPNIPDPSDPQSYNRYSYTRNNPVTETDPSGFVDATADCSTCNGGTNGNAQNSLPPIPINGTPIPQSPAGGNLQDEGWLTESSGALTIDTTGVGPTAYHPGPAPLAGTKNPPQPQSNPTQTLPITETLQTVTVTAPLTFSETLTLTLSRGWGLGVGALETAVGATLGYVSLFGCGDSADSPSCKGSNAVFARTPKPSGAPSSNTGKSNPPPGSKPIDQTDWSGDHGAIKGALGLGGADNVVISPSGDVWAQNPDGSWTNEGQAGNYTGSGQPSGRTGGDRDGEP